MLWRRIERPEPPTDRYVRALALLRPLERNFRPRTRQLMPDKPGRGKGGGPYPIAKLGQAMPYPRQVREVDRPSRGAHSCRPARERWAGRRRASIAPAKRVGVARGVDARPLHRLASRSGGCSAITTVRSHAYHRPGRIRRGE